MMEVRPIKLFKRLHKFGVGLAATILTSSALLSGVGGTSTTVEAKDADHVGMTYLEIKVNTGSNTLSGVVNTEGQFNSWGGSDVAESSEYKKEQITWGHLNWEHVKQTLNGKTIHIPASSDGTANTGASGGLFTTKNGGDPFKERYKDLNDDGSSKDEVSILVLSFPGWGGGDRIPNLNDGKNALSSAVGDKGRNDDNNQTYSRIDETGASNAASAVNNKLVGSLNAALEEFSSKLRNSSGNKVSLSREGTINAVWLLANGYWPEPGKTVTYNETTGTISRNGLKKMKVEVVDNPWKHDEAGTTLVTVKPEVTRTKDQGQNSEGYTYAVTKGYMGGVGDSSSENYASDAYAITWYDIAMSISAQYAYNTTEDQSEASSTVVGDQVGGFMYSMVSGLLSMFNIQSVDQVVFGDGGHLLKSGVFSILMVVQTPFIIAAVLILGLVILDAYRKTNMQYLSTGEQRSIMSSLGRVTNALIAIALTPLGVMLLIYLDQEIVKFAIGLNAVFAGFNYGAGWEGPMKAVGWIADAVTGTVGLGVNAILAIVLAGIDVKYTWRYIARAISFALYFCISPIMFALDALKGSGRLFEFGPSAGMIWKNLTGTILMRGTDALGVVFSLHLSRLLFGSGVLIKIMSLLSAEALTNTIQNLLGVQDASIKGISQTGQNIWNNTKKATLAAGAAGASIIGAKGYASYRSGKNKDAQEILNAKGLGKTGDKVETVVDSFGADPTPISTSPANPKLKNNGKNTGGSGAPILTTPTSTPIEVDGAPTESTPGVVHANGESQVEFGEAVTVQGAVGNVDSGYVEGGTPVSAGGTYDNGLGGRTNATNGGGIPQAPSGTDTGEGDPKPSLWSKVKPLPGAWGNAVAQGWGSRGVTGDKNTIEGGGMNRENYAPRDADNYKVVDGRVRNKGFKDAFREGGGLSQGLSYKMQGLRDAGRGLGRFAGGAATVLKPGDLLKTAGVAAFAASSTLTNTKLDNYAATAIATNQMEDALTGHTTSSIGNNFARSFFGRAIGMTPGAFTMDEVTADGYEQVSPMGGAAATSKVDDGYKHNQRAYTDADGNVTGVRSLTSFGSDVKNRNDQEALNAARTLHNSDLGNKTFTTGGTKITTMTRDQVIDAIDANAFGQVNPQHAQLAQYMTENGYDEMQFDDSEHVGFRQQLQRVGKEDIAGAPEGTYQDSLGKILDGGGGTIRDHRGQVITREGEQAAVYSDALQGSRQVMKAQYSKPIESAIRSNNGAELKALLKEQSQFASNPDAFITKYGTGGVPQPKKKEPSGAGDKVTADGNAPIEEV